MKSPKQITTQNAIQTSALLYEPTSVLDHHLTSSPAAATTAPTLFTQNPSSNDSWDALSFFDTPENSDFIINSLDLSDLDPAPAPQSTTTTPFDKFHLDLLLKAASSIESSDLSTAHSILSRLTQTCSFDSSSNTTILTPLLRVSFHFKDALLSLLPLPNPPTPTPPVSPYEIVTRITAHKSFSDLSPIPQFTSFTANQTLLESLFQHPSPQAIHIIDFDIGLGGQWSSFAQEIASRSKSLRVPPPRVRITAVVPDETIETVLAADNLRDFAREVGMHLTVGFVNVGTLGTLALGRVRVLSGETVGVVLTPNVFRLIGGTNESRTALLRFVKQVSPRIVVFVDTECYEASCSFRRSFATGLEFYSTVLESIYAAAGGEEVEEVKRVERAVIRPRVFGAVAGWAPRDMAWSEVLGREGFGMVGFSEFTESQAEWLLELGPVKGFQVARKDGSMVLSWRGRDVAATSAWRC